MDKSDQKAHREVKMQQSVLKNGVSGNEKQILTLSTYLTKTDFTLYVALPDNDPSKEKLFISIFGNTLSVNYEFFQHGMQSQSKMIALPDDVDVDAIRYEFEKRILRLIIPRDDSIPHPQNSVLVLTFPPEKNIQKDKFDFPKIEIEKPVECIANPFMTLDKPTNHVQEFFSTGIQNEVEQFHSTIPGFKASPLVSLPNLAAMLGVRSVWVKDESKRLNLNAFKVLGGSYAIAKTVQHLLQPTNSSLNFDELTAKNTAPKLGKLIFAAATDGNHGKGVAWAASQLGYQSIIYVHKLTSQARIRAIENSGAKVVVVDGTYDDAVRKVNWDAKENGWLVISDTAWEGYEDIPRWVMQGYTTMLSETQRQFAEQGIERPSHVFVQAGVGALAAATIGFYAARFKQNRPLNVVVEPGKAACLFHSMEIADGDPHSFAGNLDTIMAGLACGDPNPLAWPIIREHADFFIKCPDYVAAKGMRVYGSPAQSDPAIISGESGAVTLGALMFLMQWDEAKAFRKKLNLTEQSDVLLINSEGNTDPDHYRHVVWDGGEAVPAIYKSYWP